MFMPIPQGRVLYIEGQRVLLRYPALFCQPILAALDAYPTEDFYPHASFSSSPLALAEAHELGGG